MPHVHLDTTADLPENAQVPDILEALVAELSKYETISVSSIKAYHTLRPNWAMGAGAPEGFAHLTVAILAGRSLELRKRISDGLWRVMREQFAQSLDANEVQLTLELREMDPQTYRK